MAERIVYLHGVPHSGAMWQPFVERTDGGAPDLPGFGSTDSAVIDRVSDFLAC
jgi:pimeloyl-ACP methyl ester carboxylesterase